MENEINVNEVSTTDVVVADQPIKAEGSLKPTKGQAAGIIGLCMLAGYGLYSGVTKGVGWLKAKKKAKKAEKEAEKAAQEVEDADYVDLGPVEDSEEK